MVDATANVPGAAPQVAPTFNNQTVRQVLRLSLGGDTLRIKLSNLFGKAPLTFSGVRVARSTGGSSIDVSSDFAVTFNGQTAVTVPVGGEVYSDIVPLATAPLANLAVSMYFAGAVTIGTIHPVARQTAYSIPGNQLSTGTLATASVDPWAPYYALAAVETSSTEATRLVVAFGDSHTDGVGSTTDAAKRFPNLLDDRLKAAGLRRTGIVNEGIGGNRWLNDFAGPSGNSRLDRDLLNVPGATHAIILMGINDIGFSVSPAPSQDVTAEQITGAIANAVTRAKGRGIKVALGTLLPYKGADYFSAAGETKRQAVNAWIRASSGADAVIDFDAVMRSSADPAVLNPAYDSGDHLHPNDAGYAAMAAAVDLATLQ
ncbi:SGNH/GDSL hydrolase family protein [Ramlibacter sp.]|uniref:SGNH/GDSL hydrolase family protein n=1 Tax=Ramlibacter sp. TaxID=1917967 RepID=UPI002B566893|nr:SGNH/GDSL hydrolase family protein [Ramlibacter sp.]HWI83303.1 SGNH/GDSL hydrolase family protein [Ramlibacter sp.]